MALGDDPNYGYAISLKNEQGIQSPMNWSALYQQRPAPESGDFFLSEWLRPYDKAPDLKTLRIYAGSDYAVTSRGGDYTVQIVGVDPDSRLYLLDIWRGQTAPDVWVERMLDLAVKWKPITWAEKLGRSNPASGRSLIAGSVKEKFRSIDGSFQLAAIRQCGRRAFAD